MNKDHDPAHQPSQEKLDADYKAEETDITKVHGSILREKADPEDGYEPIPLWLVTFFAIIIFWSGGYLLLYSGGFRADVYNEEEVTWGPVQGGAKVELTAVQKGKKLYTANCAACHQASGLGQAGAFPPLADSEVVLSKDGWREDHLVLILLNGLGGPIQVKGNTYNGAMPPWKQAMNDDQIASILTFIRQEWGNQAPEVKPETVKALREQTKTRSSPWTVKELMEIKAPEQS